MLIVALVLAVIGLAALVTAVVTSNEVIAWVCIAASVIGVLLLIVDALRERSRRNAAEATGVAAADPDDTSSGPDTETDTTTDEPADGSNEQFDEDYPDEEPAAGQSPEDIAPEAETQTETEAQAEAGEEPGAESGDESAGETSQR
jgi:hypothetical protein